ncbi:GDP-mannose mannosyl hydrolase [Pararobbsia silviterrae]|uniref:GDP-mannose mannosyl hydrolase n=1 Tax=Pararobbsia silviterrae TaxID=1792498 RepID=A0A494YEI0_9BURK|nr:GDP-mannose mannosyl hydrolase [Pararobbsia silviterrae]RKP59128.1 GDP-mannose mannosyl hydrolase [Pararobbsia silviterrae]
MDNKLAADDFLSVVDHTPLIAIDLIVSDAQGRFLLGRRVNRPAQGAWFVPGGRIRKDESLDDAFARLAREELGIATLGRDDAHLLGVYEHFYEDNFRGAPGISTHYVVLGYRMRAALHLQRLPNEQHAEYRWASAREIVADPSVHANSRAYFDEARADSQTQERVARMAIRSAA